MRKKDINQWLDQARSRGLSDMEIQTKLKLQGLDNDQINQVLVGAYHKIKIEPNQKNIKEKNQTKKNITDINKLIKILKIANSLLILALFLAIIFGIFLPETCTGQCLIYFFPSVVFFLLADLLFVWSIIKYRENTKQLLKTIKGWLLILPCSIHIIYTFVSFLS